jgi:Kinesin motor domain
MLSVAKIIFAYGVTGSEKIQTMNGGFQDGGVIPWCLDVIFNSMGHIQVIIGLFLSKPWQLSFVTISVIYYLLLYICLQANKYTLNRDRMNRSDIQSKMNFNWYKVQPNSSKMSDDFLGKFNFSFDVCTGRCVADTILNVESNRSHSVFNRIRVVSSGRA